MTNLRDLAQALGPYVIRVEMWFESPDDPLDLEWCGEFLWGTEFTKGNTLLFTTPGEALQFVTEQSVAGDIAGFEYRYRIMTDRKAAAVGIDSTLPAPF